MTHSTTADLFSTSRPAPAVVGTGLLALDVVIGAGGCEEPIRLWAGGTFGNVIAILSYLGWRAYPVGRLNGDEASERVRKDLAYWGVKLDFASLQPGCSTPIVVQRIRRDSSGTPFHNFSWNCPRCGSRLPGFRAIHASAAREVAAQIPTPTVFFMDRVSRGSLLLAKASLQRGAIVVFEPSGVGDPRLFREALELAHILKYSNERAVQMDYPDSITTPLLEIETLGKAGLRYRTSIDSGGGNVWRYLEPYEVPQVKDTAGAGDWCTAGIVHAIAQGGLAALRLKNSKEVEQALGFAQAMAAWSCGFEGARGGMYIADRNTFRSEVKQIMAGSETNMSIEFSGDFDIHRTMGCVCPICRNNELTAKD